MAAKAETIVTVVARGEVVDRNGRETAVAVSPGITELQTVFAVVRRVDGSMYTVASPPLAATAPVSTRKPESL